MVAWTFETRKYTLTGVNAARPDKDYSRTDCMSMVICREEGITVVLTHDRHFEQEGFVRLL